MIIRLQADLFRLIMTLASYFAEPASFSSAHQETLINLAIDSLGFNRKTLYLIFHENSPFNFQLSG